MNWEKAIKRLQVILGYYKEVTGTPGVITGFGIMVIESLLARYNAGERTQTLYDEMMEIKE
jgi:hypothetical protein